MATRRSLKIPVRWDNVWLIKHHVLVCCLSACKQESLMPHHLHTVHLCEPPCSSQCGHRKITVRWDSVLLIQHRLRMRWSVAISCIIFGLAQCTSISCIMFVLALTSMLYATGRTMHADSIHTSVSPNWQLALSSAVPWMVTVAGCYGWSPNDLGLRPGK